MDEMTRAQIERFIALQHQRVDELERTSWHQDEQADDLMSDLEPLMDRLMHGSAEEQLIATLFTLHNNLRQRLSSLEQRILEIERRDIEQGLSSG